MYYNDYLIHCLNFVILCLAELWSCDVFNISIRRGLFFIIIITIYFYIFILAVMLFMPFSPPREPVCPYPFVSNALCMYVYTRECHLIWTFGRRLLITRFSLLEGLLPLPSRADLSSKMAATVFQCYSGLQMDLQRSIKWSIFVFRISSSLLLKGFYSTRKTSCRRAQIKLHSGVIGI